jgi:glucose/arabinose dehydrogenase
LRQFARLNLAARRGTLFAHDRSRDRLRSLGLPDDFAKLVTQERIVMRTQQASRTHHIGGYCLLIATIVAFSSSSTRAATVPAGFTEKVIASGLANPTAMQFAPDGRLFVAEQGGRLRVIKDGVLLSTPFATVSVSASGERGLLGIAFDPAFLTNSYVYVYYTATSPTVHNRISRFTANGDVAVPGSEVVLLDLDNLSSATNHNGGALNFGPDGKLYAAVGDNASGTNAQSMNNLLGKVLRLNADGSIPADNPFYSSTTGRNRAIWALGLRNPFTFAFNPSGTEMFVNDVGEGTWEEINNGIAGANYGWPATEGATSNSLYDTPRYSYGRANGQCAITGGTFYSPLANRFPSEYVNDYFFADHCAGWIRRLDPATGSVVNFASGLVAPVDLKVSDDGGLYYLARGSGSNAGVVYRIDYGTAMPGITTHPASRTVQPGESVTFSVRASGPPVLRYQWQRNGVNIGGATAEDYTLSAVASDSGATFRAIVSNDAGSVTSNSAVLTVSANQAPAGTITQPATGTLYSGASVINYSGTATDPEDGALPGSAFTWRVDFHHDAHIHPFMASTSGATSGSFTIPNTGHTETNVWYRIYLTVQDSDGLTHTTQRDVLPRTVRLTLATNPAGLQLTLDGQPVTTPHSFDSVVGILRELDAPSPQTSGGSPYVFSGWSDGGAARHTIAVPSANTTYTATFAASGSGNPGLRAAYAFDEGSGTALGDASGNGLTGTIAGAAWTSSGKFGAGLAFDGTDDRVTIGASPLLNLTTGTVEAWIRLDRIGRWHGVIAKGNVNSEPSHNYAIEVEAGNVVNCGIGNGTSSNLVRSTTTVAALQFYHVACTWDGSQLRLYINGALNRSVSQTLTPAANSSPLFIGQFGGSVDRFDGIIDEVRIYNVALSQSQIQTDMNTRIGSSTPPTDPPPTDPPADSIPPGRSGGQPAGTLAAGTTQATLSLTTSEAATCRYGTVAGVAYGAQPNAFTTTGGTSQATTIAGLSNGQSYTYFVRCTDAAGNANPDDFQISFSVAVPNGLRAAYGFNDGGGTTVSDASGNGLTGTIAGAAWTTSGQQGGALSFDGMDDRVTVGSSSLLNLTTGTVEAWVRLDALGRWHGVVAKGSTNSDSGHNYAIEIDDGNAVNCVIGNGSSSTSLRSTSQLGVQQFYHLACTWDGSQLRMYINGTLHRSVSQGITPAGNSSPLFIGQYGGNVDRFDGVIDEVRIYNVALSQAQIQSDMNTPVR